MKKVNKTQQVIFKKIKSSRVLFFDMDGTLIDTNLANFLSYKKAILSLQIVTHSFKNYSEERLDRINLKSIVPSLSEIEYQRIIQRKEEYYKEFLPETKVNKSIVDALLKFSKTNMTVLVTNCRQERALETLNYHGLIDKFSKLFFKEIHLSDQFFNKFKNAISKLNIPPKLIIAFEDEKNEIAKARQAGIQIINPRVV